MSNTFFMSFGDQKDTFCDKSTTSYKYAIGISKKKKNDVVVTNISKMTKKNCLGFELRSPTSNV